MRSTEQKTGDLASRAADAAMKGAVDWLVAQGVKTIRTLPDADVDALLARIREEIKVELPKALADARAAFEAGMGGFAGPTFMASMTLAGVRAAKAWKETRS